MSLNLNKHGSAMQAAWRDVLNPDSPINWALYGYEGNTFDLRLIETGEDGIEELREELNANKIMYAFCQVDDPTSSLAKFVLLHWQGEGAPGTKKGLCATHLRDIQAYFHGSHLTVNARNEDEVNVDEIVDKVSKVSAGKYNFKERAVSAMEADESPGPVGSTHKRIIPAQELPRLDEREKFWTQQQDREKERLASEKQRKISERQELERERVKREEQDTQRREQEVNERERKISAIRDAEKKAQAEKLKESERWAAQQEEDRREEEARRKRSDILGKERSDEARQLISQRSTADAKAVFERNSSAGQMNFRRQSSSTPASAAAAIEEAEEVPATAADVRAEEEEKSAPVLEQAVAPAAPTLEKDPAVAESQPEPEKAPSPRPAAAAGSEDLFVPPPASFGNDGSAQQQQQQQQQQQHPDVVTQNVSKPDLIQDVSATENSTPDVAASNGNSAESADADGSSNKGLGLCARAIYDYQAADDTEISFDPGQQITNIDQIDLGWWQGLGPQGNYGLFPANYVEII